MKKLVCGVGFCDIKTTTNRIRDKEYGTWTNVLNRCYSGTMKNYKGCRVSDEWLIYSKFKKDIQNMIGFNHDGWQLDKDLLVKGNKVYSKENCCFIPQEINKFLTDRKNDRGLLPIGVYYHQRDKKFRSSITYEGKRKFLGDYSTQEEAFYAYKSEKEFCAKELAVKWYGFIDNRVYNALLSYTVNIED